MAVKPRIESKRLGRWLLNGTACIALAYILLPLAAVIWLSLYSQEIPSFPPQGYSLRWYAAAAHDVRFVNGLLVSIQVAISSTVIGLAVGVPAALVLARSRGRGVESLKNLLTLPLIVPGVVLGTALYIFHVEIAMRTGFPILGSTFGLVSGHVLVVIPWTVRLITASLAGFNTQLEEAAQNLGADRFTTFRRITLPLILPGVVAAAMFGFAASFGNLEMSLFLVGPGRTTLPIAIMQYLEWKIDPSIAAISVIQIALIAVSMLVTDRFVRISRVV